MPFSADVGKCLHLRGRGRKSRESSCVVGAVTAQRGQPTGEAWVAPGRGSISRGPGCGCLHCCCHCAAAGVTATTVAAAILRCGCGCGCPPPSWWPGPLCPSCCTTASVCGTPGFCCSVYSTEKRGDTNPKGLPIIHNGGKCQIHVHL